jgi:tRNA pseudouridine55 synthase
MKPSGFLLVDKPAGVTSHNVVTAARKYFQEKRIGHAGTLDPFATGLLVLAVGKATRLLQYVVEKEKVYLGVIELGGTSTTDDFTGEITYTPDFQPTSISDEEITAELHKFVGKIKQRPSSVSAIKVNGKRAYQLVREGVEVELKEREVEIFNLTIKRISRSAHAIEIEIEVKVSAGTYIRAIARDLGERLGAGGYLTELRRISIGKMQVSGAAKLIERELTNPTLLPITQVMDGVFPFREVSLLEENEISFGRNLPPNPTADIYLAINGAKEALALLENHDKFARPILVLMGE